MLRGQIATHSRQGTRKVLKEREIDVSSRGIRLNTWKYKSIPHLLSLLWKIPPASKARHFVLQTPSETGDKYSNSEEEEENK